MTVTLRPAHSTAAETTGAIPHGFARESDWMPKAHTRAMAVVSCGRMIELGWVAATKAQGQLIGRQILEYVKAQRCGLSLFAFQDGHPARRCYERNGFTEVTHSDGSKKIEKLPDIKFVWKREGESDG